MKSLIAFQQVVLKELGTRCGISTSRDSKTIADRVEQEGLSFLTITLANFGGEIQKSLAQSFVGHDQFPGFARTGSLPRFLGGFFDLVFDRSTGRLLANPSVDAIICLRQITLMWAKIQLPCTPEREKRAIDRFIECEQEVRQADRDLHLYDAQAFGRIGRMLWADYFSAVDARIYREGVKPKHGPGATADKLKGNLKFVQKQWTNRLESEFPHWELLISSESFLSRMDDVDILEPGQERPVKVTLVPKTLKTPRIIAIEPACMQYVQQGILELMVEEMPRNDFTRNLVMSDSQEHNQVLAKEGSITGTLATLDLSEASDRVSNQHVRALLLYHSWLFRAVDACRSRKADVPGYGVQRLAKFASMGSALCFPFESIVFATVIFVGIEQALNRKLTEKDVRSLFGMVRVYGDDIIVPVEYVSQVIRSLEAFGFRVNTDKSFWTGRFRESCGADYYDGRDVSIVRVRSVFPESPEHASELISTVSLRNQLFEAGYNESVGFLDKIIEGLIPFPVVESTSVLLGRRSYEPSQAERWDRRLQRPLVRGVHAVPQLPASKLDDYGALLKWFLKRGDKPFEDKDHLKRAGRPTSLRIKNKWAPPY